MLRSTRAKIKNGTKNRKKQENPEILQEKKNVEFVEIQGKGGAGRLETHGAVEKKGKKD